ncbi:hypothetical protein HRR83_004709 [Exophiala dermatitidis]|uniref:SET domain-containing protein n=1 Tax=Exophiala dermatitidis TaxID=5970 RepID=A0AAN6J133_EXODE|nr:hypothetical protein HRR76_002336 [Exophiala dermatitidis]KAJ4561689.1 hypothetical protein HRR79_007026 [Exophiala dermatitidis]KAJ4572493.1 hypothetical protein HRR82_006901 [Exophiala dermatitidis]KAJ4597278.1 hypothetical protein HRR83_004709 [Exophiala dermatitidis]KAJ4616750.1 hypothetical protein HRR86_007638 [Exophiala dermatitidis]
MKNELVSTLALLFLLYFIASGRTSGLNQGQQSIISAEDPVDIDVQSGVKQSSEDNFKFRPASVEEQTPGSESPDDLHGFPAANEPAYIHEDDDDTDIAQSSAAGVTQTHRPNLLPEPDSDAPLCVFTNASFASGRGISIFTTPAIAAEMASLLPFHNPTALTSRGINHGYPPQASSTSTSKSESQSQTQTPWYTAPIPGKGTGMLASQQLHRGDLILATTPYLLSYMENLLSTVDREHYLRIAIEQLPERSKEHYLSLAKIYGDPRVVVQDVVKANAFEMQVGGRMHLAVFPEASRINHACGPNAQYHLQPTLLTHYVYAARSISPDEEITIAYAPPLKFRSDRMAYLESTFHFRCTCSRCAAADERSEERGEDDDNNNKSKSKSNSDANSNDRSNTNSNYKPNSNDNSHTDAYANNHLSTADDAAVADIHALQWSLSNWESNSTASVKKAEMLIRLYQKLGLDAFMDTPYGHAALIYNAVGSVGGAQKYARLAAEAALLKYGPDVDGDMDAARSMETWRELMRNPMGHSSWRRRKQT